MFKVCCVRILKCVGPFDRYVYHVIRNLANSGGTKINERNKNQIRLGSTRPVNDQVQHNNNIIQGQGERIAKSSMLWQLTLILRHLFMFVFFCYWLLLAFMDAEYFRMFLFVYHFYGCVHVSPMLCFYTENKF